MPLPHAFESFLDAALKTLLRPGVLCLVPPCAAAAAVVIPLRSLAGVIPPVQDEGVAIVDYGAHEEGDGAIYARHQEYPEHYIDEAGELLKPCRRKVAAEYEAKAADYHAQEAPEHALAAAYLVKQAACDGA